MTLQNLLLEPAGTLVKDSQELLSEPLNLLYVTGRVHIRVPGLALARERNLVLGPLAREVDAYTGHYGGGVPQAHGGQV